MNIFTRADAPRLRPFEIAASFVSRLAAWLRYTSANRLCFDVNLRFEAISSGDAEQLQALSELTETPLHDLRHSPVREGRQFRIDGHLLSTAYLDRIDLWICPECAKEDLEAAPHLSPEAAIAIRRDDIVTAIGSCARHRRTLVHFGRQDWKNLRHDTSMSTVDVALRLDDLLAKSRSIQPSSIDCFVRERFDGKFQGHELLDPLSLNDVLKLSGRLGNWLDNGGKCNLRNLGRQDMNRIYSLGLDMLIGGMPAIERACRSKLDSVNDQRGALTEAWAVFGDNRGNPGIERVRQAFISACRKSGAGESSAESARLQIEASTWSLAYATIKLGLGMKALMSFAQASGAFTSPAQDRITVSVLRNWMQEEGGIISASSAAQLVGCNNKHMLRMINEGVVSVVVSRTGKQGSYDWLRRDQVEKVRDEILAKRGDRRFRAHLQTASPPA